MITLEQWMKTIDYRITESDTFGWNCYGYNSHSMSSWNGEHGDGGWSSNIVFDRQNQTVYEVEVCDYGNNRAYRLINPDYKQAHDAEVAYRGGEKDQAWDDVNFIDLETDDDFLDKSYAIVNGVSYDTRVVIPLEIDDEMFNLVAKKAHDHDITFNEMIEVILKNFINSRKDHGISI